MVTATGDVVRASESERADLLWGLRGGGGNFGIVTAFEFDAYDMGPDVMDVTVMYDTNSARDVMRAWRDWSVDASDEVTTRVGYWSLPDVPDLPEAVRGRAVLIVAAVYAGPADAGERVLQPLRELAAPLADLSGVIPFRAVQQAFDPFFPKGVVRSYWKSLYLRALDDDTIDFVVKLGAERTSPMTFIHVPMLGGAMRRVAASDTAFGDRSAEYMLSIDGNWYDEADDEAQVAWVRTAFADAARFGGGTYLNFDTGDDDARELVDAAYGANIERLRALKRAYDPANFFRLNNNVVPAEA
jgi:FAD/FMN-containing dehydrogenase